VRTVGGVGKQTGINVTRFHLGSQRNGAQSCNLRATAID
jgi:hypothetical protein